MTAAEALYKIPFLIGVVGHRDLVAAEVPQIRAAVERLLRRLTDSFPDVQPTLLSSMAEGADLLAAEVASELGIPVITALAFSPELSRADLATGVSKEVFDRIFARAEHVEAPDLAQIARDDPAARDRHYQRAGVLVARYSTLLVAIWDGKATNHEAGTARVVEYRRGAMIPTADDEPLSTNALLAAHDNDLMYDIRCSRAQTNGASRGVEVLGFVGAGVGGSDEVPRALATTLERIAAFNRDIDAFSAEIIDRGRKLSLPTPYPRPVRLSYLDNLFRSSDWLGTHYRRCFTRALRARYALWAVMAFLLLSFKKESFGILGLVTVSGVLLVFVLGLVLALWAHRSSWHRKYLDYRALAEGLRVDFYWEIAGVRRRFDGEFAHESFLQCQDSELEWIRAAMRTVSLRLTGANAPAVPSGFTDAYAGWIGDDDPVNGSGQLLYYRKRIEALERNLRVGELIGRILLFSGLGLALLFGVVVGLEYLGTPTLTMQVREILLWALALLTVGAVIFDTYVNEKADRALVRQYRYMYSLFGIAARELGSARSDAQKLGILRSLGHACLAEHAQWILGHRDKRIEGLRW
jgi:hypothetical protein